MRIALAQMRTGIDPGESAERLGAVAADAAAGGAAMLFTPEMTNLLDRDRSRAAVHVVAEEDDPVLAASRRAARRHRLWIHLGSVSLRVDGERFANRGFVIDSDGGIAERYDKLHLFDVDLPDGTSIRESAAFRAGERCVLAPSPAGLVGLSICYDLRFPALYQALAGAGATILSVPAAFTVPTGEAHWHVLLRARAIETGCFVVAAAQSGEHADGRTTYGHSLVVDPWGRVLLDMGRAEGLGFATLDLDAAARVRAAIPVTRHRRTIPPPRIAGVDREPPETVTGGQDAPVAQLDRATVS